MIPIQIALISQTSQVRQNELNLIAAAIQKQITRDFSPIWQIAANISAFSELSEVPLGYYPIIIKENINYPGAAGIHMDRNGQPYALVQSSENVPLTCSHECLEMLVDPFGNRFIASQSLMPTQGRVNYLEEVCDPSEDIEYAYTVNGIVLSDFYTPNYFDPVVSKSIRYSFSGAITQPKQVLPGGYISWLEPISGEWWQATFFGNDISYRNLGKLAKGNGKSWRELIDSKTFEPVSKLNSVSINMVENHLTFLETQNVEERTSWARDLEEDIEKILNSSKK